MSDKSVSESRRDAIKAMMGGLAAVPLMSLVGMTAVQAKDLEKEKKEKKEKEALLRVDEKGDPTATALQYKHKAPEDKEKAGQTCATCQFIQADSGEWRPCQLFPGKAVAAEGWCASWMKKAGA